MAPGAPPAAPTPPPAPPMVVPPPGEPVACAISVAPLSPQRFSDIPAGEGYRLRVGGRASGNRVPATPTWRWVITHESNLAVPHKVVDGDPAVVEFPDRDDRPLHHRGRDPRHRAILPGSEDRVCRGPQPAVREGSGCGPRRRPAACWPCSRPTCRSRPACR